MKIFETEIKEIATNQYYRSDYKYVSEIRKHKKEYKELGEIFDIINGISLEKEYSSDKTNIGFIKIGDLNKDGINYDNVSYINEEANIPKEKILRKNDIVLATIGSVGKVGFFDDINETMKYTTSNNTVILRLKDEKKDNAIFYAKLFQTQYYRVYFSNVSSIKEQPNLQPYDLYHIKIPEVSLSQQNNIIKKINEFEKNNLVKIPKVLSDYEIINEIMIKEFDIQIETLEKEINSKTFVANINDLCNGNVGLRCSYRWNKLEELQEIMYKNIDCLEKLGEHIISTQNGWSPLCNDEVQENKVIGIDAINADTKLDLNNIKYTNETKKNIEKYYIKNGELFLSRGNTVDLVGMASIAEIKDEKIIYPDLMIKVSLDNNINKKYVAYIINSIIGRTYFKYVSKGKNISMVKISSNEINDFLMPIPKIDLQNKIVMEIDKKILEMEKNKNVLEKIMLQEEKILTNELEIFL